MYTVTETWRTADSKCDGSIDFDSRIDEYRTDVTQF